MKKLSSKQLLLSLGMFAGGAALSACATDGTNARYGQANASDCCYQMDCGVSFQECGYVVEQECHIPCPPPPPPPMQCPYGTSISPDGSYCLKIEYKTEWRERALTCPAYTTKSADGTYCLKTETVTQQLICPAGTERSYDGTYCLKIKYKQQPLVCPIKYTRVEGPDGPYCKK